MFSTLRYLQSSVLHIWTHYGDPKISQPLICRYLHYCLFAATSTHVTLHIFHHPHRHAHLVCPCRIFTFVCHTTSRSPNPTPLLFSCHICFRFCYRYRCRSRIALPISSVCNCNFNSPSLPNMLISYASNSTASSLLTTGQTYGCHNRGIILHTHTHAYVLIMAQYCHNIGLVNALAFRRIGGVELLVCKFSSRGRDSAPNDMHGMFFQNRCRDNYIALSIFRTRWPAASLPILFYNMYWHMRIFWLQIA